MSGTLKILFGVCPCGKKAAPICCTADIPSKNTSQMNDAVIDRVPAAPVVVADNLTTYEDQNVVTEENRSTQIERLRWIDPYETKDLRDVLTRNYKIATFSFSTTDASGDPLLMLQFPEALFNLPFISDKLRDYMLFRGSVKVTFRFNATKFAYGTFMVGYIPYYDGQIADYAYRHVSLPALAQCDSTIISVTQGEAVEVTVPWLCPKAFVRIAEAGLTQDSYGGEVYVRCLNPLRSAATGVPPAVLVNVFANFEDPQVAGYSPAERAPAPTKILAQSNNKVVKEAVAKNDVFTGIREATSSVTAIIGAAGKVMESAGGSLSKALPMLATFGFDKPTIVSTPQNTVIDPDGFTHMYGKGVDVNPKVAIDPETNISTDPSILGVNDGSPNLLEIVKQPSFISAREIVNADITPGDFFIRVINNPMQWVPLITLGTEQIKHPSYTAHYGLHFKYWRGSMKYIFDFRTSSLVTARVRITHFPEQRSWVDPVDDYSGDVVSKVVDIAGDTMVPFTIPFLSDDYWKPIDKAGPTPTVDGSAGLIAVCFESRIQGPDPAAAPSIFLNVWSAAGDDFQYFQKVGELGLFYPNPSTVVATSLPAAQSNMRREFSKTFEGLRPHLVSTEFGAMNGEKMMPIQDYLHRYVSHTTPFNSPATSTEFQLGPKWDGNMDINSMLCSPFLFWRGAMRLRTPLPLTGDITIYGTTLTNVWDPEAAGVVRRNALKPTPGIELPWYYPILFKEVSPTQPTSTHTSKVLVVLSAAPGSVTFPLTSVGDDFTLGPLSACPQWAYDPGPALSVTPMIPSTKIGISSSSAKH